MKAPKPHQGDAIARDAAETREKIAAACLKLARKFRERGQRATERHQKAKNEEKRLLHRRRFELYGDAATDLEERARILSGVEDRDG